MSKSKFKTGKRLIELKPRQMGVKSIKEQQLEMVNNDARIALLAVLHAIQHDELITVKRIDAMALLDAGYDVEITGTASTVEVRLIKE